MVNGEVKLFLKQNELDETWMFPAGIKLLQDIPVPLRIEVAPFREISDYGSIYSSVSKKYFPQLSNRYEDEVVDQITKNWETRITSLVDNDASQFDNLNLELLKDDVEVSKKNPTVMNELKKTGAKVTLQATFYDIEDSVGIVNELEQHDTVVVYTNEQQSRPWIGLFEKHIDGGTVEVHWLKKFRNSFIPHYKKDGSAYKSEVPSDAIMFSNVMENSDTDSCKSGPWKLPSGMRRQILAAYDERDKDYLDD